MLPQFQRVVTLSVMCILVGLFTWIYIRERKHRARLWMIGWSCIVVHFAGMLLFSFHLIPERLSDWSAYATLIFAASAFFLSVSRLSAGLLDRTVFWAGLVIPAVAYWTGMVYDIKGPLAYRALLILILAVGAYLVVKQSRPSRSAFGAWCAAALLPGAWAIYRAAANVETGIDFILFEAFAITGWCYWMYFRRISPGVLLTSLSFLAWGLVFPIAELCAALNINIPGDHVVWDLPKYFVAFGMIVTLFENQTASLQVEIAERKRAEEAAQAADEAKSILMASMSFAAQRFLSAAGWQSVISETLAKIGVAARVRRVYLARHLPGERDLSSQLLHEWAAPDLESPRAAAAGTRLYWIGCEWSAHAESLRRGEVVVVPASDANGNPLSDGTPHSTLLVPIEVAGEWFGILGFDDHRLPQRWSDAERNSFRSAARMLGAAIARQRSQEYVDNILRSMEEALLVTDLDLCIRRVNPSALRLLGYAEEELLGRCAKSTLLERESPTRRSSVERTYLTKDGKAIPVLFSSAELKNDAGAVEGYVWLAHDMTELHRVQSELVRAKEAAEDANRAKSTFLANMSHELRTPLNAVIGYSEMLREVAEDRGEQDLLPDLERIRSAGKHLLGLINDVLDLAKIEAGKVQLCIEPFEGRPVVLDVLNTIQPLAEKNGNRLELECDTHLGTVIADQTRVRQVLLNLLSNACKFTEHGRIRLQACREVNGGAAWAVFRVSDTGIGMSPEHLQRLYRPFQQADASTTRKYGGTGLGLTISREFCLLMRGSVAVESELGKGSSFTVRLPAQAPVQDETETGRDLPRDAAVARQNRSRHALSEALAE